MRSGVRRRRNVAKEWAREKREQNAQRGVRQVSLDLPEEIIAHLDLIKKEEGLKSRSEAAEQLFGLLVPFYKTKN